MSVFDKLEEFIRTVFKTTVEVFYDALRLSPNAQGYVSGSISELLLKQQLESLGYTVERIKEKWEGQKHENHHGDFYFRGADSSLWYVLESKGVKSNAEKWHKLYNPDSLVKFMFHHSDKICWIDMSQEIETQIKGWINTNLPKFKEEYASPLYEYEEVKSYMQNQPGKETPKSRAIAQLKDCTRADISRLIEQRLEYLMTKLRVLETHFVAGKSGSNKRTQATPRKDEFNLVAVDIFLRYYEHKFLFANSGQLEASSADSEHLQQNYVMGFVFLDAGEEQLSLSDDWLDSFPEACGTLAEENAVDMDDMQIDERNVIYSDIQPTSTEHAGG